MCNIQQSATQNLKKLFNMLIRVEEFKLKKQKMTGFCKKKSQLEVRTLTPVKIR